VAGTSEEKVEVEIVPGITAASAAAAILGAPVMHDFAVISLSDLLTPWELIQKRLECAAAGDFVVCLYNPKSKNRSEYIGIARDILLKHRNDSTPVGIVRNAGRQEQCHVITTLKDLLENEIDMFSVVIIGNSKTYVQDGRMITPRGYDITV
jgi:precorrin-3B C17-methyltransferase